MDAEYEVQCPECGWVGFLDECDFIEGKYCCPDCLDKYEIYSDVEDWEPEVSDE